MSKKLVVLLLVVTNIVSIICVSAYFKSNVQVKADHVETMQRPIEIEKDTKTIEETITSHPLITDTYNKINLYKDAIESVKMSMKASPPYIGVPNMGKVHAKAGRYEEAIKACKRTLHLTIRI